MRLAAILLTGMLGAAPAVAQPTPCETSIAGPIGEVIATRAPGSSFAWVVEARQGVGEESEHFARPSLLLDFRMTRGGVLELDSVMVSVTRVQGIGASAPPPMSRVQVKATADGGRAVSWAGNDPARGEADLLQRLKAGWPRELELAVVVDGAVVASAVFDLSGRGEAERMAREALGRCG